MVETPVERFKRIQTTVQNKVVASQTPSTVSSRPSTILQPGVMSPSAPIPAPSPSILDIVTPTTPSTVSSRPPTILQPGVMSPSAPIPASTPIVIPTTSNFNPMTLLRPTIIFEPKPEYTPKQFETYQKAQLLHQQYITKQLVSQKLGIDPTAQYTWERQGSKGLGTETGAYIIENFLEPNIISSKEYENYLKQTIIQTKYLSPSSIIKKTNDGFDIISSNLPGSSLDWIEYFVGKTEDLPFGVKQITEFGMGLTSDVYSFGSWLSGLIGQKQSFEFGLTAGFSAGVSSPIFNPKKFGETFIGGMEKTAYGIHLVTPFDVAFEPLGLSPKGSTEFLGKHPLYTAGGVFGEIAQALVINAGINKVMSGFKYSTKQIISNTPTFAQKFEPATQLFKPITSRLSSIMNTKTMQNFEKWAVEGYKPGKTLLEVPAKTFSFEQGGLTFQKFKYITDKSIPFWERRIWMSPEEIAKYESRLAGSGVFSIGFPEAKAVGGIGNVIGVTESEVFQRGLLGMKPRYYIFSSMEKQLGTEAGTLVPGIDMTGSLGGFVRGQGIVNPVIDLTPGTPNIWFESVKSMYKSGYPYRFTNLEGGTQIIDWTQGFGGGPSWVFEKSIWSKPNIFSKQAMRNFVGDIRGVGTSFSSNLETINIFPSFKKIVGDLSKTPTIIPISGLNKALKTGIVLGGSTVFKTPIEKISTQNILSTQKIKPGIISDVIPQFEVYHQNIPVQENIFVNKPISIKIPNYEQLVSTLRIPVSETLPITEKMIHTKILTGQQQIYSTKLIPVEITTKIPKIVTKIPLTGKIYGFNIKTPVFLPPLLPKMLGGYGGGGGGSWDRWLRKGYRYRKHKVPTLEDILKNW